MSYFSFKPTRENSFMNKRDYFTVYTNLISFIGVLLMLTGIDPLFGAYIAMFGVSLFSIQVAQISLNIPLKVK
jgi:hypothetical protein